MRAALDLDATLADTISPGSEWIELGPESRRTRKHVMSYLGDFLFAPSVPSPLCARCRAASATGCCLRDCSRCRPMCWCSTSRPTTSTSTRSNCSRTCCRLRRHVFLVSHDRRFLDNVVTSTIAWEGDPAWAAAGLWREYEGGYEDWKLQRERTRAALAAAAAAAPVSAAGRRPAMPRRASHRHLRAHQAELQGAA